MSNEQLLELISFTNEAVYKALERNFGDAWDADVLDMYYELTTSGFNQIPMF